MSGKTLQQCGTQGLKIKQNFHCRKKSWKHHGIAHFTRKILLQFFSWNWSVIQPDSVKPLCFHDFFSNKNETFFDWFSNTVCGVHAAAAAAWKVNHGVGPCVEVTCILCHEIEDICCWLLLTPAQQSFPFDLDFLNYLIVCSSWPYSTDEGLGRVWRWGCWPVCCSAIDTPFPVALMHWPRNWSWLLGTPLLRDTNPAINYSITRLLPSRIKTHLTLVKRKIANGVVGFANVVHIRHLLKSRTS